jgi:diaminopimelate epimerase
MKQEFYKYHGTGNDFIIIDNRDQIFEKSNVERIESLCNRKFGIGADGLILLENHKSLDFKMIYFNADGNEGSMCGNGGRCITHFAKHLDLIENKAIFEAIDGAHKVVINEEEVKLQMQNVSELKKLEDAILLNTGSPHYVCLKPNVSELDVNKSGAAIRYSAAFNAEGINVNFVEKLKSDSFLVRTYERGVEGETSSCGTGVTGVAIAMNYIGETEKNLVTINTQGGILKVQFDRENNVYKDIWLIGPAVQVYKGEIEW